MSVWSGAFCFMTALPWLALLSRKYNVIPRTLLSTLG